eukprot:symbB.v1.2.014700.t1/scaffold1078.1/size139545/3
MNLEELHGCRCQGNVVTYSGAMAACERTSRWHGSLILFEEMVQQNLRANVVSYGAAVAAAKDWRLAISIVKEMLKESLQINTVHLAAAIASCG